MFCDHPKTSLTTSRSAPVESASWRKSEVRLGLRRTTPCSCGRSARQTSMTACVTSQAARLPTSGCERDSDQTRNYACTAASCGDTLIDALCAARSHSSGPPRVQRLHSSGGRLQRLCTAACSVRTAQGAVAQRGVSLGRRGVQVQTHCLRYYWVHRGLGARQR
jgi:hypothetical protein